MLCYYHQDRPAVGICKHCQRGLCMECAAVSGEALACRNQHEVEVTRAERAARRAMLQAERVGSAYIRSAVFYGLAGSAFALLGLLQLRFLGLQALFLLLIGVFLLYAAVTNFMEGRRFR